MRTVHRTRSTTAGGALFIGVWAETTLHRASSLLNWSGLTAFGR